MNTPAFASQSHAQFDQLGSRFMRWILLAFLLLFPLLAYADGCTMFSVTQPDGSTLWCTQCCYSGVCNIRCN